MHRWLMTPRTILLLSLSAVGCIARTDPATDGDRCRLRFKDISVTVENTEGENLALTSARVEEDGVERPCSSFRWEATCTVGDPGMVTVTAFLDDLQVSGQVEVKPGPNCSLEVEPLVLVDERPVCVPSRLTVIEGELLWSEGQPVSEDDDVQVWASVRGGDDVLCPLRGSTFSCPPEAAAYNAGTTPFFDDRRVYRLKARFGLSTLTQDVPIAVVDCEVSQPMRARFVRSDWPCSGAVAPAVRVYVGEPVSATDVLHTNFLPAAAVRILDADANASACALALAPPAAGGISPSFLCSVATPAAGTYTVEISHESRVEHVLVQLHDDGCAAFEASLHVTLLPDQICESHTYCSPSGVPLKSYTLCPRLTPEDELPAVCR